MLEIAQEKKNGVEIIHLRGDVRGRAVDDLLHLWYRLRVESHLGSIAIDLSQVASLDSRGSRILDFMQSKGTTLLVCEPPLGGGLKGWMPFASQPAVRRRPLGSPLPQVGGEGSRTLNRVRLGKDLS